MAYEDYLAQDRAPTGFFSGLLDYLSRGQYFSAKFFDTLASQGMDAIGDAFIEGLSEAVSPQERLGFADILKRLYPDMNPVAREIAGTAGNVLIDPTNAFSFGSLGATKVFGRALSKSGLLLRSKEIGDAMEAAGYGAKRIKELTELARSSSVSDDVTQFVSSMIGDEVDKIGAEAIGQIPKSSALSVILKGFGLTDDSEYLNKLKGSANLEETLRADFGGGKADSVMNYLGKLQESPDPREALMATFGRDAVEPTIPYLEKRADGLLALADKIKRGEATNLELDVAWRMVSKHSDDPHIMGELNKRFPEWADKAVRAVDLEQVANRTAEETVDKRIADLASLQPELFDKGGVKILGKSIVPGVAFSKMADVLKITQLKEVMGNNKALQALAGAFNRNFKLPPEFRKLREDLERALQGLEDEMVRDAHDIFAGLSKEQRELIGKVGHHIQDATVKEGQTLTDEAIANAKLTNPKLTLTDDELRKYRVTIGTDRANQIADEILTSSGLKNDKAAYASYVKLRHSLNEIGIANMKAGLMEEMIVNYFPHVYNTIKDPDIFRGIKREGLSRFLPAGETRVFSTIDQAKAAGWEPEMDALLLYTQRALESKQAISRDNFVKATLGTFGVDSIKDLPKFIRKDITFIGESQYPLTMSDGLVEALKMYDWGLKKFKKLATVVRPSFGVRQLFSNALQSYLSIGAKAFHGVIDPRSNLDAIAAIMYHRGAMPQEAGWLDKFVLETPFGKKYTGAELSDIIAKWGVIRGTNIASSSYEKGALEGIEKAVRDFGEGGAGLKRLFQGAIAYTNWPSHIEDFARTSLFMNALRMGHDPRAALNIVNTALFDYKNGLSRFARVTGQRVFPFLSFNNFVLPLIGKVMLTHPNRIANVNKIARGFLETMNKAMGGQQLNPSERSVLPGYLLEQPNYLESLSDQGKALFRTFNNFSPLDVIGSFSEDERGDIDWRKTIEKVVLAQVAPQIKMPFETLFDKSFFTGQQISKGGKLGKVQAEEFLSNAVGILMGAKQENAIVGAASKIGSEVALNLAPEFVKDSLKTLIGWEPAVDNRTGEETVYINPWMYYMATNLAPALSQTTRVSREDSSPTDKWLDFVLGVGTQKQDLPRNVSIRLSEQERSIRKQKEKVYAALRSGRHNEYEKQVAELEELMKGIVERRMLMMAKPITGIDNE